MFKMSEKSEENILPHHVQQTLCTSRLPYRQGRKLTAVKVYTINNESKHLLIFGVPSLNLRQEAKALFLKFGKLLQFNLTAHPSEQFTETYHALYEHIAAARLAKRMLDTKNFYGGCLHVCYAPELETVEETRDKMLLRQKNVLARLKNLQRDAKEVVLENKTVNFDDKCTDSPKNSNKIYMGDVNNINIGKKTMARKRKLEKRHKVNKNIQAGITSNAKKEVTIINTGTKTNIDINNDLKKKKIDTDVEIIDFTSAETETLSNINEALNYKKFGEVTIRQMPFKPLNKIKFNLNKNT